MDKLVLIIGNDRFEGWQEIRVRESLEKAASNFSIKLTDRWTGQKSPRPILLDSPCTLFIDRDQILSGYVDDVSPDYDSEKYSVEVKGRSKTGDLIDCSLPRKQYKNQSLSDIAKTECQPFGIKVIVNADVGDKFKQVTRDAGETIFEFLEPLARMRALRLTVNIDGDLVITQAGSGRCDTALILGKNINRGRGHFVGSNRFSEVTVMAQQAGSGFSAEAIAEPKFTARNSQVKRYRPQVILSQQPGNVADCQQAAEWRVNTQQALSRKATFTVKGWRQSPGGKLWQVNTIVPVSDSRLRIQRDMLIVQRDFILDAKGLRTDLTVAPKEGYELLALPEPEDETEGWL